jgi:hypothetical protein
LNTQTGNAEAVLAQSVDQLGEFLFGVYLITPRRCTTLLQSSLCQLEKKWPLLWTAEVLVLREVLHQAR